MTAKPMAKGVKVLHSDGPFPYGAIISVKNAMLASNFDVREAIATFAQVLADTNKITVAQLDAILDERHSAVTEEP